MIRPRVRPLLVILLAACAILRGVASAQPAAPTGRVMLYTEPNYRGECLVVEVGSAIDNLEFTRDQRGRPFNDRISSIRFDGPVLLLFYEHSRFRGAQATLTRNAADLSALALGDKGSPSWDKTISSLRVEPMSRNVFIAWTPRDADRAIRSAYRDILGRDPDDAGLRNFRGRLLDAGWSEDQLRDNLRRSPEFKTRDTDALVRSAYRDVLGREPDPAGLANFKRALEHGMSDAELRAELRRSSEGAQKSVHDVITRAYRELLHREPDPAGLANFTDMMLKRGWDEGRVRDALRKSDEYRNLPRH